MVKIERIFRRRMKERQKEELGCIAYGLGRMSGAKRRIIKK
jgi:hypothetical protein